MQQLTSLDQPRLNVWYKQAVNCLQVRPYLQHTQYNDEFQIPITDWGEAFFMDDASTTLMRLGFDRTRNTASIRLYSLPGSQNAAAGCLKALVKLHKVYFIKSYIFAIHDSNKKWLKGIEKRFSQYCWGVEPSAAYDTESKTWVSVHHFSIPVDKLVKYKGL